MKAILAVDRAADALWPHSKPLTGEKTDKEGEFQVRPESPSAPERAKHREELWKATFDWERESAVIGTKLEAYFPVSPSSLYEKETIPAAWSSFGQNLSKWLTPDAMSEWSKCRESLLQEKAALIQEVLAGSAPSFGPGRLSRHRRTDRR